MIHTETEIQHTTPHEHTLNLLCPFRKLPTEVSSPTLTMLVYALGSKVVAVTSNTLVSAKEPS